MTPLVNRRAVTVTLTILGGAVGYWVGSNVGLWLGVIVGVVVAGIIRSRVMGSPFSRGEGIERPT